MNIKPTRIAFSFQLSALSFLCVFLLLFGCATVRTETELKDSLRQRAEEYWKLRMKERYEETYKMESKEGLPLFGEYFDKVRWMKKINVTSHSIKDTKVEGQKGIAELKIFYRQPPRDSLFERVYQDEWVFINGKWLHVFTK